MTRYVRIACMDYLMRFQTWIVVECWNWRLNWILKISTILSSIIFSLPLSHTRQTKFFFCVWRNMCSLRFSFCLNAESHPLWSHLNGRSSQWTFLMWILSSVPVVKLIATLLKSRKSLITKFFTCCECRRTLIAVIIFDFKMTLQMFLNVLLLKSTQSTKVALESLFF